MDIWAHLSNWGLWPPDLVIVCALLSGLAFRRAVRGWREFGIFAVIALLFIYPLRWTGAALGWPSFGEDVVASPFTQAGGWQFPIRPVPALLVAIVLATYAMVAWKRMMGVEADTEEANAAAQIGRWRSLSSLSGALLALLTGLIHLATIFFVPASVPGLVATFFLPVIAQVYWLVVLWPAVSPLSQMCLLWLCVFAIWLLAQWMLGSGRKPLRA